MATEGKASLKRSKPNYLYSIVGVALVLLIMGIIGWVFLNFNQLDKGFKEDIRINVYLRTLNKDTIGQIQQYVATQPYAKTVEYIDKEKAKKIWNNEGNEDWEPILTENPLPESIEFKAKAQYINADSLQKISQDITGKFFNQITNISYRKTLVNTMNEKASRVGIIFLVVSILLCTIVIFSIDNTIRLAMFSNRFLIKTMQMVGATRGFIAKPMNIRAVINGLISALIAIALLFGLIQWAESQVPEMKQNRDWLLTGTLFGGMIVLGVGISVVSTHRSVMKYLKMKLDELY
jgi:cell division transport system permease protein